jgi:hypothetical protein
MQLTHIRNNSLPTMVFICIPLSPFYVFIYIRLFCSVSASVSTSQINHMIHYVKYHFKFYKPQCLQTITAQLNFKILHTSLLLCDMIHYVRALTSACPQDITNNNYTFLHNMKIYEWYKAMYITFTNIFHIFILLHIQYIRIFFVVKKFVFALSTVQ